MTFKNLGSFSAAWSPALSPDATLVAYVSDRDGKPRIWIRRRSDGSEVRLDTGPHQVREVRWSIDGFWLAAWLAPGGSPRTEVWVLRPDGQDLHRVGGPHRGATHIGPWTHQRGILALSQALPAPLESITLLEDAQTGRRRAITSGGQPMLLDLDRENRCALVRRGPRGARTVWTVDLDTGRERQLLSGAGAGSSDLGRLAPDARHAYVRSDAGRELHALLAVTLGPDDALERAAVLAERADADLENLELTADGKGAFLSWNAAGQSECELLELATEARTAIPLPEPVVHESSFSRDGRWLALTLEGPTEPKAVWLFDTEFRSFERVTQQAPGWEAPEHHPTLERLRAADGLELSGWLYRPSSVEGPGPTLIHLHGGPEAQERPGFNPLFQELLRRGVGVFAPNVRGSSGFGRSFLDADVGAKRWNAIADVAACAGHLVERGIAAPGRIACAGRSYGGYLTLAALVEYPKLFAAGVDVCGIADFQTFYTNTEPWIATAAYPRYGHPEKDAALLRALSPIHRFDALRAPLLVVHGSNDSNVPLEEAAQVVAAARSRGVPVEYLLFEDEGHELAERQNRETFVQRTVDFLLHHLG